MCFEEMPTRTKRTKTIENTIFFFHRSSPSSKLPKPILKKNYQRQWNYQIPFYREENTRLKIQVYSRTITRDPQREFTIDDENSSIKI